MEALTNHYFHDESINSIISKRSNNCEKCSKKKEKWYLQIASVVTFNSNKTEITKKTREEMRSCDQRLLLNVLVTLFFQLIHFTHKALA